MSSLTIELKLLKLFQNREPFNINDFTSFDTALSKFEYPIGIVLSAIERCTSSAYTTSFSDNYLYVSNIIQALYNSYYTEAERNIISAYIVQRLQPVNESDTTTLNLLNSIINAEVQKTEVIELQKILKYYYTQTLILYHSERVNEIQQLLDQLDNIEIIPDLTSLTQRA